jgi:hypothetical protein
MMKYIVLSTAVGFLIGSVLVGLILGLQANLDCAGSGLCGLAFLLAPLILFVQLPWIAIPGVPDSVAPYFVALNGALYGLAGMRLGGRPKAHAAASALPQTLGVKCVIPSSWIRQRWVPIQPL